MPRRTMVPLAAIADTRLSPGDLRVLLSLGGYADAKGQNVWASVPTLCAHARVSRSSFFRSIKRLMALGYVTGERRFSEDGRQITTRYTLSYVESEQEGEGAIQMGPRCPTQMGREGAAQMGREGPTQMGHKPTGEPTREPKKKGRKPAPPKRGRPPAPKPAGPTAGELEVVSRIWRTFPKRVDPKHDYVRARKAIVAVLRTGIPAEVLEQAAEDYAEDCRREGRAAKYVKGMHNFYADDYWRTFRGEPEVRVDGLTRDEWIRARMDVAVFDTLANGVAEPDDEPRAPDDISHDDPFELMDSPT